MGYYANSYMAPRVYRTHVVQLLQCTVEESEDDEENDDDDDNDDDINFTFYLNHDAIIIIQKHMINQNLVLLDNKSTVNIFSNKKFLRNIRHCEIEQGAQ